MRLICRRNFANFRRFSTDTSRFATHENAFKQIVGDEFVLLNDTNNEKYFTDWTRNFSGGAFVCLPKSTLEVSQLVQYCNKNNIGVVPQGGNTGLVGGAVGTSNGNEMILSLARMNSIISIDTSAAVVTCEAGCVLEILNTATEAEGYIVPLDLGAKGSCMIGGNIATNAGGLRVLKYGSLHKNVLGLEVVLPDGTILDMLRSLHKDNCGYPLKHMFIGSEGTLGVITKVCLSLAVKPKMTSVILAKVPSFSSVQPLLTLARQSLGDSLSAFEFMDRSSVGAVRRSAPHLLHRIQPGILPTEVDPEAVIEEGAAISEGIPGEVSVLLEVSGNDVELDALRLDRFVIKIVEEGAVLDAVLSQDIVQEKSLWNIRENVPVSLMTLSREKVIDTTSGVLTHTSRLFKYDVSLALSDTDWLLVELRRVMSAKGFIVKETARNEFVSQDHEFSACTLEFCSFGHAGDQNLHLNILATVNMCPPNHNKPNKLINDTTEGIQTSCVEVSALPLFLNAVHHILDEEVFRLVLLKRGSISAEHGIGQMKRTALLSARSASEMDLMRVIKKAVDPKGIMNPGKVL